MEFKATLPAALFKIFSVTLDALSRLGDDVKFVLSAINNSLTAQGIVRLSPLFFETYELRRNQSLETALYCRVFAKGLNNVFKKNQANIDQMDRCGIHLTEGDMTAESKMETTIKYRNGVLKKSTIWYAPEEKILALYSKEQSHHITIDPSLLRDCLDLFDPKVMDILVQCTPQCIIFKTFWDYNNAYQGDKPVQSSFKLNVSQCIQYDVTAPVKLVFNFREFKVILDYMAAIEAPLEAHFEESGRPILFDSRQNNEIIAEFALNTQNNFIEENTPLNDHSVGSMGTSAYESRQTEEPSESSIDLDADTEPENRLPSRRLVRHIPSTSSSVQLSDSEEESRKKRRALGKQQDDSFF